MNVKVSKVGLKRRILGLLLSAYRGGLRVEVDRAAGRFISVSL